MATTRFDIIAKMPESSSKDDAPKMLQSLLEERFKLAVRRTTGEHPVLALVVGKGGLKLKTSAEKPVAIDEDAPLKPGEMKMDGPEGPVRAKVDITNGSSVIDMGLKGKMAYRMNPATRSMHIDFSMTTMAGLADMLTQLMNQLVRPAGGVTTSRQFVDMTGIKGNYDATVEISLDEVIAMARAAGADFPQAMPPGGPTSGLNGTPAASDPGGSSVTDAIQSMGLKLENRKATTEQLVVDHIEKAPTDN